MTREEIGSYLGLKLETVSRAFSKFQEEGLIAVQQRHIRILDIRRPQDRPRSPRLLTRARREAQSSARPHDAAEMATPAPHSHARKPAALRDRATDTI